MAFGPVKEITTAELFSDAALRDLLSGDAKNLGHLRVARYLLPVRVTRYPSSVIRYP
jgi:hypothetical protein